MVTAPPLVQNPPGTTLTANANSGFLSSAVTGVLGAPLAFVVDKQSQSASITQYTNGNIGLSAPDISPTKTADQVTFTGFFTQQTSVQAAGGLFATGTSSAGASVTLYQGQPTLDLQYSDFGLWKASANSNATPQVLGVYAIGNTTPSGGLPKSGSLVFTGNALGTIANTQGSGVFGGLASLTANFSNNQLLGSISDIRAQSTFTSAGPSGSVNPIVFSGTINGASFSGQASTVGGAGTAFDITGAGGTVGGNFYGSNTAEAVGVFSLTGGATQTQIMGAFGATQSFSSNDISAAVPQMSALPNGTPLTANFGTGFVSATQIATTTGAGPTQTTSFAVDGGTITGVTPNVPSASFIYYSNGNVGLQAPNIPYYQAQTTTSSSLAAQFGVAAFNQQFNGTAAATGLPYGTIQATAIASAPGFPSVTDEVTLYRVGGNVGLQYSDFGEWKTTPQQVTAGGTTTLTSSYGFYGVGVATPTSQMPTTGSALYTGSAFGVVGYKPSGVGAMVVTNVTGVAALNANFASGALTGGIVGLRASSSSLNDITFKGTISGNGFTGTATAGTNVGGIDLTGAAGKFGGGFYGPNAKEITGTFSLAGGQGVSGIQLIGSFGAHK